MKKFVVMLMLMAGLTSYSLDMEKIKGREIQSNVFFELGGNDQSELGLNWAIKGDYLLLTDVPKLWLGGEVIVTMMTADENYYDDLNHFTLSLGAVSKYYINSNLFLRGSAGYVYGKADESYYHGYIKEEIEIDSKGFYAAAEIGYQSGNTVITAGVRNVPIEIIGKASYRDTSIEEKESERINLIYLGIGYKFNI